MNRTILPTPDEKAWRPAWVAVIAGGAILTWPAVLNSYPLLFIDSVSYLLHSLTGQHPWDKTAVYGPLLSLFHWRISLWGGIAAQAVLLSWLIWRIQRATAGEARPGRHLVLVGVLGLTTTAPWFVSLALPDMLSAVVVLVIFLLGCERHPRGHAATAFLVVIGALAVASHLSHLGIAGAIVVVVAVMRRAVRSILVAAAPVLLACLGLLTANLLAFERPVLSAHGSFFLLARLQADGPATETMRRHCPSRGWTLCDRVDALPMSADAFLWSEASPILRDASGAPRPRNGLPLVGEASEIARLTLREMPLAVAGAMATNALRQTVRVGLGDTFDPSDLRGGVAVVIADLLGDMERRRFEGGAQMRGTLVTPPDGFFFGVLAVAAVALVVALLRPATRRRADWLAFVACVIVGFAANAFMTGALSGPHDRYGARIAWIVVLAAGLAADPPNHPRRGIARSTSARLASVLAIGICLGMVDSTQGAGSACVF